MNDRFIFAAGIEWKENRQLIDDFLFLLTCLCRFELQFPTFSENTFSVTIKRTKLQLTERLGIKFQGLDVHI